MKKNKIFILSAFAIQGLATHAQIMGLLGTGKSQTYDALKQMTGINPLLWSANIPRPWVRVGSGRFERTFALTEIGAKELSKLTGERYQMVDPTNNVRNLQHNLALVDIAIKLLELKIPHRVNRRLNVTDQDDYVRPDITFCPLGAQQHIIELEQSRFRYDLDNKLFERMLKWEELFSGPESHNTSSDIIVLFSLEKWDDYTIASWMSTLDALIKKIQRKPSFKIWFMPFEEFYRSPTLDIAAYNRLEPSNKPGEKIMQIERERVLADEITSQHVISNNAEIIQNKIAAYHEENSGLLRELQTICYPQEFFFNLCDWLYKECQTQFPDGYERSAIPWLSIGVVRYWLELDEFSDLRQRLIAALSDVRAAYMRGLSAAADAMERMVWNVLLRYFGFTRGGPLAFYVMVGSDKEINKRSGLIPVVKIEYPWNKVRESEAAAIKTETSLTWLIDLITQYPNELGLTKDNKRGKSSYVLSQSTSEALGAGDIAGLPAISESTDAKE